MSVFRSFERCPFALYVVFPRSLTGRDARDYYGGSERMGLASRSVSRILAC